MIKMLCGGFGNGESRNFERADKRKIDMEVIFQGNWEENKMKNGGKFHNKMDK